MLKKIFNFRNLIFLIIMVALFAIILSQQATLDRKKADYSRAVEEARTIAEKREDFETEKAIGNTDTSDEELARGAGYVYDGEIVFDYD